MGLGQTKNGKQKPITPYKGSWIHSLNKDSVAEKVNPKNLVKSLQKIKDDWKRSPTVFLVDSRVYVSAEDGNIFADYYGEFRGGFPWISPLLEKWAKEKGMHWEWENPGCIGLYE